MRRAMPKKKEKSQKPKRGGGGYFAGQSHLAALQKPSSDSDEQAMYGFEVSYETPEPVFVEMSCIHWYGPDQKTTQK